MPDRHSSPEAREAAWLAAAESGECVCVYTLVHRQVGRLWWPLIDSDSPVEIDPACEIHAHLLTEEPACR